MPINQVFAGIAVVDYGSALAWYTRFLRRPPDVEARDDRPACIGLL
ncbi:MAG TPA: hypothetical protein VFZ02_09630 [Ktedonobacteraceae bacterium]